MKALLRLPLLVTLLALDVAAIAPLPEQAQARTLAPAVSHTSLFDRGQRLEARVVYRPSRQRYRFPRWGAPAWSTGGAARGGCRPQEAPLVPLMPVTESGDTASFFGVTLAAHPTFFAYVPQTTAHQVEFLLVDEEGGQEIYQKRIAVTGNPQIISVKLDDSLPPLMVGRNYKWFFTTICDPKDTANDSSGNPYIPGLIQRIEPSSALASRLQKAPARDRANLYAEEGVWLDSFTTLAQLRCQKPNDRTIATDFATLLDAVDLEKIPSLAKLVEREKIDTAPLAQCF